MSEKICVEDEYIVDDLETLKVLSDPFRLRILELLGCEPATVKQIAAKLKMSPKKLYYHVNLLEKHGLIVVADTRMVSGILEKQYQVRARQFVVNKSLLALSDEPGGEFASLRQLLGTVMEATSRDVIQAARQGLIQVDPADRRRSTLHLHRCGLHLRPEKRGEFVNRLESLIAEFAVDEGNGEAQPYGLTVVLHPAAGKKALSGEDQEKDG